MTKLMIVSLVTLALPFSILTHSSVQDDPRNTLVSFLEAEKNHDLIQLIRLSKDSSSYENNVANHIALLSRGSKSSSIVDYEILTTKKVDDSHVEFSFTTTEANGTTTPPIPMTVVKKNGKWIVDFQLVEIKGTSVTKMTSKLIHNKEELRSKLSPQMTSVAYWAWRQNQ